MTINDKMQRFQNRVQMGKQIIGLELKHGQTYPSAAVTARDLLIAKDKFIKGTK